MRPCAIHLRPREVPFAWPLQGRLQGRSYRLAASTLLLLRRAVMALAVGSAVTPDFANFMTRFSAWRSGLPPPRCTATCATRSPSCVQELRLQLALPRMRTYRLAAEAASCRDAADTLLRLLALSQQ